MGTELTINGTTLYAGRVPGRKTPALGMREGSTLAVLGYFISESECEHFERWMESIERHARFRRKGVVMDDATQTRGAMQ